VIGCECDVNRGAQEDMKLWPFRVVQGPADKPLVDVEYMGESKRFAPEEISAMVLVKMKSAYACVM
jgi:heat shock protein 1/8